MDILIVSSYESFQKIDIAKFSGHLHHYKAIEFSFVDFSIPDHEFDWIFFGSKRAVRFFLSKYSIDFTNTFSLATIGEKTKQFAEKQGLVIQFTPKKYTSIGFAKNFLENHKVDKGIFFPTSQLSKSEMESDFRNLHIPFTKKVIYKTCYSASSLPKYYESIIFASPSCFESFIMKNDKTCLQGKEIIAIGEVTKKRIQKEALVCKVPEKYTLEEAIKFVHQNTEGKNI